MTAPPTYVLALPVAVTVNDHGTVTFDADLSEAAAAPAEYDPERRRMVDRAGVPFVPTPEVLSADVGRIEVAVAQRSGWV